jgi:hypothetical protein
MSPYKCSECLPEQWKSVSWRKSLTTAWQYTADVHCTIHDPDGTEDLRVGRDSIPLRSIFLLVKGKLMVKCILDSGCCKGTSIHFLTFPLFSPTLLYSPLSSHIHPCSYVLFPTLCTITRCQTLKADDSQTSKTLTHKPVD